MTNSYIEKEIILEPEKEWGIDELQSFLVKFTKTFSYDKKTQSNSFRRTDKFLTCKLMHNGVYYIIITYNKNHNFTVEYYGKDGRMGGFTFNESNLASNVDEFRKLNDNFIEEGRIKDNSEFKFKFIFTLHLNSAYKHTYKELTDFLINYNYEPSVRIGHQLLTKEQLDDMINEAKLQEAENPPKLLSGGKKSKKLPKKEILGKMRCIYKIPGDRKEYLKHKGKLITVKEYKELMKAKPKKKEAKPKKVKKTKSKK